MCLRMILCIMREEDHGGHKQIYQQMENTHSRDALVKALEIGGEVLLDHFGKINNIKVKDSFSSVVTEADLAAEKAILDSLNTLPGQYNFITEETGFINNTSDYTWVIDPLDGTSNFVAGLPWFGVLIALFHKQEPLQAGMYLSLEKTLYYAGKGEGAWKNNHPILTTDKMDLKDILVSYSFDYNSAPGKTLKEMELIAKLSSQIRNIRATNSLYDFCCLADGRLGAAINQTTKIWDIAAPWLVIREAGGKVTDISGREISFDVSPGSSEKNYTILASTKALHERLMSVIPTGE